ncbi:MULTISPECIES: DUF1653 domain-containing protein [Bacillus amyloliquefaciens group]|uniref:DUF1653 domain-containing protein n=1 Tax=Bacillus amyloliquefaciens group TaxID=1938374 RepID=UPI00103E6706|nr:DUF1653 domain-containing protein [Bacillus velezensis]TCJ49090.1 DUF1653 domain-containing protein [Bacillus velezensis]
MKFKEESYNRHICFIGCQDRHYKGGLYMVIGEAVHTETEEKLVTYEGQDGVLWKSDY